MANAFDSNNIHINDMNLMNLVSRAKKGLIEDKNRG